MEYEEADLPQAGHGPSRIPEFLTDSDSDLEEDLANVIVKRRIAKQNSTSSQKYKSGMPRKFLLLYSFSVLQEFRSQKPCFLVNINYCNDVQLQTLACRAHTYAGSSDYYIGSTVARIAQHQDKVYKSCVDGEPQCLTPHHCFHSSVRQ